jgi:protein-S-isoprenylcysteine O-methyltransferase Ste14
MHAAPLLALTYGSAKNIAIVIVIGLAVIAVLMAKFVAGVSRKAVMLLICAGLALGVWTQRSALQRCADDVRSIPDGRIATCQFFGQEIEIKAPTG